MLKNYLIIAWRGLLRNKLHSFINVLGLSIGISACLVIFILVRYEFSFDKNHFDGDRIYRLYSEFAGDIAGTNRGVPAPAATSIANELTGIESIAAFQTFSAPVSVNQSNEKKNFELQDKIILAGPEYFSVFSGYDWVVGTPTQSLSKPFQVVLTESKARKYFGFENARDAIGHEIHYRDSLVVTVSGILRDNLYNTDLDFTDFISFSTIKRSWLNNNFGLDDWTSTNSSSQLFVKLLPGVTQDSFEPQLKSLDALYAQHSTGNWKIKFHLQPLSDLHFNTELEIFDHSRAPANRFTLRLLSGLAVVILLIAAINFINLETALAIKKAKEVGIRKVMGSTRIKLVANFMMQSVIISVMAVGVSIPLSMLVISGFTEFVPEGAHFQFDAFIVLFLLGSVVCVSFLAGFYPAFSLSGFKPVQALKNQTGVNGSRSSILRKGLIVFQFSFAQLLILATLIIGSQIRYMLNKDLGFSKEAVVYVLTPWWEDVGKVGLLKNEWSQFPEIEAFSLGGQPPAYPGYSSGTLKFNNGKEELHHNVFRKYGDTSFLNVYGLKLLAGRNLIKSLAGKEFIVNETYARLLGFENPEDAIDKVIINGTQDIPIVGVVKDFHFQSLHKKIEPLVIYIQENNSRCIGMRFASASVGADISKVFEKMDQSWKKIYPEQKPDYHFLDDTVAKFYEKEQRMSKLVNTATGIAIFISCLGLFGLASYTTVQRTKEIGIRKVLGATVDSIMVLLSMEFLKPVLISFVIAAPLSVYFAQPWLDDFAYHAKLGWYIFALTMLAALVLALLAVGHQAFKAASADPAESLKYE